MNEKLDKKDKLNKKPKKEIGSFSIRYLKSLFLKETKTKVPQLMENFIDRRYYDVEDNSENSLKNRDTSHDKLTDVYISEIRAVSREKLRNMNTLLEESNKEDDLDSFVEKSSQERPTSRRRVTPSRERKNYQEGSGVQPRVLSSRESRGYGTRDYHEESRVQSGTFSSRESRGYGARDYHEEPKVQSGTFSSKESRDYGSRNSQDNSHNKETYIENPPQKNNPKKKKRTYTLQDFKNDFNDEEFNEYENMDKNTYKDLEEINKSIMNEKDDDDF